MAVQRVSISDDGLQALFVSSDSRLSVFSTNVRTRLGLKE